MPKKLLIIEDQHLIREMLILACRQAYPRSEIHAADSAQTGLEIFQDIDPHLILLDIALPDGDGVLLAEQFRQRNAHIRIIALSSHLDEYTLHRAQSGSINGFVDKNAQTFETVKEAIATVMEGRPYACSSVRDTRARMREAPRCFSKVLSNREMELLVLLGHGKSNEEISRALDLSIKTVANHRQNIMTKLGLNSVTQLLRYAAEKGFSRAPISEQLVTQTPESRDKA